MPRPTWTNPPSLATCNWRISLDDVWYTGKGIAGANYVRTHLMPHFVVRTDATQLEIDYYVDNLQLVEGRIAVYVPSVDAWVETTIPLGTGVQNQIVTVPGSGLREVRLIPGINRSDLSVWINEVTAVDGTTIARVPVPSALGKEALIIAHDSLLEQTQSSIPQQQCALNLLRNQLPNTVVMAEGVGGGSVAGFRVSTTDNFLTFCKSIRAAAMASGVLPADVKVLLAIGTNDFGLSTWGAPVGGVPGFQAAYESMLTRLRTFLPAAAIYCQTLVPRTTTTNGLGQTFADFVTAINTARTNVGDPNTFAVDGSTLITDAATDCYDGLHFRDGPVLGHGKYATNIISALGLS